MPIRSAAWLLALSLLCTAVAAPPILPLGDFEQDLGGFSGSIARDAAAAHGGQASAKIVNPGPKWVTASTRLNGLEREILELRFWARSTAVKSLAVRLVDQTGQNLQQRVPLAANGEWQEVVVRTFAEKPGVQNWGGANDGKLHPPAQQLDLIVEQAGTVWLDDMQMVLAEALLPEFATRAELLAKAKVLNLGDFEHEKDLDGFKGAMKRDPTEAKVGQASARLTHKGPKWSSTGRDLPELENDFLELRFWVKSTDVKTLAVRLVDRSGQSHQQRPEVKPNGEWQQLVLRNFAGGRGYQSFGGADDKKWHAPARNLVFILEQEGTIWIDGIEAVLDPRLAPELAEQRARLEKAQKLLLADFEGGSDGFAGPLTLDPAVAKTGKGSARLTNPGERWVTATKTFGDLRQDFLDLSFWVRSTDAKGLTVRLVDATGQTHQQRPKIEPNGEWQQLVIANIVQGPGYQSWGGASDKKWHPPAQSLSFLLEQGQLAGAEGSIWLDGVAVALAPELIVADLACRSSVLGNVFLTSEAPVLPIETRGDTLRWTVTDFWHRQVAGGTEKVGAADSRVHLRPPGANGYYLIHLEAEKDGKPFADAYTSYAVLPPVQLRDRAASPFGVMTHFAQGMDPDILELFDKAGIASVRDEHYWQQVEAKPGEYVFNERSDAYMAALKTRQIDPLIAMTFANKLYDGGSTPYTPEGCDAYARYGQAILKQYPQVKFLEVWNEYNGTWCKGPAAEDRPRYYAQMCQAAYRRIKEVRPDVQVLGTASVLIPIPYIKKIFEHGGLEYMDGIAVHPYRSSPEGVENDVEELRELIRKFNKGQDKPIWITETGRMDKTEYPWEAGRKMYEAGRENIARYLARQYTLLLTAKVEKIYWYLCRDHMEFLSMGLLRHANDPLGRYAVAPAYVAYATLIRQLDGAQFLRREPSADSVRVYLFRQGGEEVRVCWATEPAHVAFAAARPLVCTDLVGATETLTPLDGQVGLTLDRNPRYLRGPAAAPVAAKRFQLAGEQRLDVGEAAALACTLDLAGLSGSPKAELEIAGQRYPLGGGAARIVLPGRNTAGTGDLQEPYRLLVDGQTAALGQFHLAVGDPLSLAAAPALAGADCLSLAVANHAARQGYRLEALAGKLGTQPLTAPPAVELPAGQVLTQRLAVAALPPWQEVPLELTLRFAGRSPLLFAGTVADNPIAQRRIEVDGKLADWGDAPILELAAVGRAWGKGKLAGQARLAWDAQALYVALSAPTLLPLRIGVAAAADNARWHEFDLDPATQTLTHSLGQAAAGEKLAVAIAAAGNQQVCELALPWTALAPLAASDDGWRLALALGDDAAWLEWGQGLRLGHSPAGFRLCRRVGGEAGPTPGPGSALQPLAGPPAATVAVLASADTGYAREQGANHWFYGYYDGTGKGDGDGRAPRGPYTDDDFQPMSMTETMWGEVWQGPVKHMTMGNGSIHPGVAPERGLPLWSVRRWVSPYAGPIRISGALTAADQKSDGVGLRLLVDGLEVFAGQAGGKGLPMRLEFDATAAVQTGSRVDFAVTPGPGLQMDYDASNYSLRIDALK